MAPCYWTSLWWKDAMFRRYLQDPLESRARGRNHQNSMGWFEVSSEAFFSPFKYAGFLLFFSRWTNPIFIIPAIAICGCATSVCDRDFKHQIMHAIHKSVSAWFLFYLGEACPCWQKQNLLTGWPWLLCVQSPRPQFPRLGWTYGGFMWYKLGYPNSTLEGFCSEKSHLYRNGWSLGAPMTMETSIYISIDSSWGGETNPPHRKLQLQVPRCTSPWRGRTMELLRA